MHDESETPASEERSAEHAEAAEAAEGAEDRVVEAGAADEPDVGGDVGEAPRAGASDAGGPRAKARPSWPPPPPERLEGAIEAILLVAGDVVRLERLRDLLGLKSVLPLREAIESLRTRWTEAGLAMELEEVGGGVRVVTRPEYAEYVGRLMRKPPSDKLTRSQLETLCIVAYKQPVGRAEVERIRGVQAGEPLRALLERRLLKVVGRSDLPGRPLLYGTTQVFLTAFGLKDVKDLPSAKDLQRL